MREMFTEPDVSIFLPRHICFQYLAPQTGGPARGELDQSVCIN